MATIKKLKSLKKHNYALNYKGKHYPLDGSVEISESILSANKDWIDTLIKQGWLMFVAEEVEDKNNDSDKNDDKNKGKK